MKRKTLKFTEDQVVRRGPFPLKGRPQPRVSLAQQVRDLFRDYIELEQATRRFRLLSDARHPWNGSTQADEWGRKVLDELILAVKDRCTNLSRRLSG